MKKTLSFLTILSAIIFFSCEREIGSIGLDLQGDSLGNLFSDSSTVLAYSILEDSIFTKNLTANVVGFLNDPIFGSTQACLYAQFLLSGNSVDFGDSPVLDSVVLTLKYSGAYGDTLSPTAIRVYELTEKLDANNNYYHNSEVAHSTNNLTYNDHFTVRPKPNTPTLQDTTYNESQLRIRLSDDFGYHFLNNPTSMANATIFGNYFYGLYIAAEATTTTGNLIYINLTSSLSGIQIYYKKNGNRAKYSLPTGSTGVRFNTYKHSYTNANSTLLAQLNANPGNPSLGKEKLFIQGGAGVAVRVAFPHLKSTYGKKNVVINRAELVITNVEMDDAMFMCPEKLTLQGFTDLHNTTFIPDDEYYTSSDYFGGIYDATKKEYRFRITRYIQQLIFEDTYQNYLNLKVSGTGIRGSRLVCSGTDPLNAPDSRLRLELSYTEY